MCSALKREPKSEETKQKISQTLTGRIIPSEVIEKIKVSMINKWKDDAYRNKLLPTRKGENNGMFGKHHTEEVRSNISKITKERMRLPEIKEKVINFHKSKEYKLKLSNALAGRLFSEASKRKMREAMVKNIIKYGIHARNFNPTACKIIDEYGKQNGYTFQHALNGGEFHVKGLGYLVDGYDKEKNVVLEIDEKNHFDIHGNLREKDIIRQERIEKHLGCKFIRIPIEKGVELLQT